MRVFYAVACGASFALAALLFALGPGAHPLARIGIMALYMFGPALGAVVAAGGLRAVAPWAGLRPNRWWIAAWLLPFAIAWAAFVVGLAMPGVSLSPDLRDTCGKSRFVPAVRTNPGAPRASLSKLLLADLCASTRRQHSSVGPAPAAGAVARRRTRGPLSARIGAARRESRPQGPRHGGLPPYSWISPGSSRCGPTTGGPPLRAWQPSRARTASERRSLPPPLRSSVTSTR
jgi:hypothetical protein